MKVPTSTHPSRSVLITGASTGIGEACALHLASRGWRVFAGVRRADDGEMLVSKSSQDIIPVILDVTSSRNIAHAADRICGMVGDTGLQGLVNNAGIGVGGPLEFLPFEQIMRQFEVNLFGAIAVTQRFIPLVRQTRGRIVFVSSNSGFWCEPFLAAYGATKHGLEAIGDSLRVELRPWGIQVALIEPGMINTPIWDKARHDAEQAETMFGEDALRLYAGPVAALRRMVNKPPVMAAAPHRVALAVQHALEARRPRTRYRVGIDARIQYCLRRLLPDRVRDRIAQRIMGL